MTRTVQPIRGFEDLQARKPRRKPREIEDAEQIALMNWLKAQHQKTFEHTTHPPNGGHRGKREAGRFKAMGTKAGVPDVLCFEPHGGFSGLAVEMKRPGAPPSAATMEQLAWIERLTGDGWICHVCRGFDEAKRAFEAYLAQPPGRGL